MAERDLLFHDTVAPHLAAYAPEASAAQQRDYLIIADIHGHFDKLSPDAESARGQPEVMGDGPVRRASCNPYFQHSVGCCPPVVHGSGFCSDETNQEFSHFFVERHLEINIKKDCQVLNQMPWTIVARTNFGMIILAAHEKLDSWPLWVDT